MRQYSPCRLQRSEGVGLRQNVRFALTSCALASIVISCLTLPLWFRKWYEHIEKDINYGISIRLFMHDVFESMAEFIEGAAMFRIEGKHEDYEFYKYEPFTTPAFESFVSDLRVAFNQRRPVRDNLDRSRRYIETGNIQNAMSSMSEAHIASTGRQLRESNEQLVHAIEQRVLPLVGNMMGTLARGLGSAEIVASLTAAKQERARRFAIREGDGKWWHGGGGGKQQRGGAGAYHG